MATPELRSHIADEAQLDRAKVAQHKHRLAVLSGDADPTYAERVERIAAKSAALGLSSSQFMGAYATVLGSVGMRCVFDHRRTHQRPEMLRLEASPAHEC